MLVTAYGPGSVALATRTHDSDRPSGRGARVRDGDRPRAGLASGVVDLLWPVRCVSRVSVCLVDYFNTSSCQDAKGLLDLDP